MRITLYFIIFLICAIFFSEIIFRAFFVFRLETPLFLSSKKIINYFYYPELKKVDSSRWSDGTFKILILSESTFNNDWGTMEAHLFENLSQKMNKPIKIFNLAQSSQTSRDSYFKYEYLRKKHFDQVIFYHGLNDARANNCLDEMFKKDYSHYAYYRLINRKTRYENIPFFITPFVLDVIFQQIKDRLCRTLYVPKEFPRKEWMDYGGKIKTREPFKENLSKILEIAKAKNESVLLMTCAYYISEGYSLEKFKTRGLDYKATRCPLEIWGNPENIEKTILAHNQVTRELALEYRVSKFVDQEKLMPKIGKYYNDICHLSDEGCELFIERLMDKIQ